MNKRKITGVVAGILAGAVVLGAPALAYAQNEPGGSSGVGSMMGGPASSEQMQEYMNDPAHLKQMQEYMNDPAHLKQMGSMMGGAGAEYMDGMVQPGWEGGAPRTP